MLLTLHSRVHGTQVTISTDENNMVSTHVLAKASNALCPWRGCGCGGALRAHIDQGGTLRLTSEIAGERPGKVHVFGVWEPCPADCHCKCHGKTTVCSPTCSCNCHPKGG